jgi:ubiquinone/menaquinone biosynthesis C-methylase UbiE
LKKIELIPQIKKLFENGENIIDYLKKIDGRNANSIEDILISYDFQAGSYVKWVNENYTLKMEHISALAKIFAELGNYDTVLEAGVGEATTLANLAVELNKDPILLGFDISWSRILYGIKYAKGKNVDINLFVADLFNIPLKDSSIDIVYTSHSIEPNGGREREALIELYRVTKKYLVLLEPASEFATEEGKLRMINSGYIQNLAAVIKDLKYDLIEYRPYDVTINPLNPTALYIIKKEAKQFEEHDYHFCCPISKNDLQEHTDHFFSAESFISYPKIMNIPCLCAAYGILTSKHE